MCADVQVTATPYRQASDNLFASACSLSLSLFFLISLIYKYAPCSSCTVAHPEHDVDAPSLPCQPRATAAWLPSP